MNNTHKLWRCVIANIMYIRAAKETKELIDADIRRYSAADSQKSKTRLLDNVLLSGERSFRSIFYYRLKNHKLLCGISKVFLPDIKEIELYGNITGEVYLSSPFMVVSPEKTGKNLHVCAGVIIGKNHGYRPVIGDNVYIGANSTVIGKVNIGDNVIIKAGSVVTRDVPSNTVYGGNPARFVRENTENGGI